MMRALLVGTGAALSMLVAAQGAAALDTVTPAADVAKDNVKPGWKVPRTAWGDPDLRGKWPLDYLASTPRTRPARYGTRAELTDEEYATALAAAKKNAEMYDHEVKIGKMGMGHWTERGLPLRQNSLMTEPANGRMPPATPEGEKRSVNQRSSYSETAWDWVDDFNNWDRCITRGIPGGMLPGVYNSGIEVMQAPGYVIIRLEMVHETRIIPLDGRPLPPPAVKGWLGYSRGHWEGNSLIIETSNFVPDQPLGGLLDSAKPIPNSDQMKMRERLTPTGPDSIRYEAWIEDPVTLTAPFKLDFPWRRNDKYELFEYACHEGNVQLRGFITSSRAQRAAAQQAAAQGVALPKEAPQNMQATGGRR